MCHPFACGCVATRRNKATFRSGDAAASSLDLILFKSPSQVVRGACVGAPGSGSPTPVQGSFLGGSNTPKSEQCFSLPSTPCTPQSLPDDTSPISSPADVSSPAAHQDDGSACEAHITSQSLQIQKLASYGSRPERAIRHALFSKSSFFNILACHAFGECPRFTRRSVNSPVTEFECVPVLATKLVVLFQ
jgi:hypothetical protein